MTNDTAKTVLGILAIFVALPVAILWLRNRVSRAWQRRRNPPEKIAADHEAFQERLRHPDWSFYERHLQRPAPQSLRQLLADHTLLLAEGLDYPGDQRINTFNPLDEQALLDTRPWLGFDAVAIATSDFGDPIYLRPGPDEPDVVYITHHDGGDTEVFADSVAAMLGKIREVNIIS